MLFRTIADCLQAGGQRGQTVASLRRGEPDGAVLAQACADLYIGGHQPRWEALLPRMAARTLPAYPWQRERYWKEAEEVRRDRLGEVEHSLLGVRRDAPRSIWRRQFDGSRPAYLADHRVMGANLFPGAGYVEMALAAGRAVFGAGPCVVEHVQFHAPVVLRGAAPYLLDTTVDTATGTIKIDGRRPDATGWVRHASARLAPAVTSAAVVDLDAARARCGEERDAERCYAAFAAEGFDYGPRFQSIQRLWLGEREAVGRLTAEAVTGNAGEDLILDPIVLDGCFQMLLPFVESQTSAGATVLPIGAERIVVHGRPSGELWAHATATESSSELLTGDVVLTDAAGHAVIEVRGFQVRVIAHEPSATRLGTRWLHRLVLGAAGGRRQRRRRRSRDLARARRPRRHRCGGRGRAGHARPPRRPGRRR